MQIYAQPTLIILQHEPSNLKCEISPNNAKHYKQEVQYWSALQLFKLF